MTVTDDRIERLRAALDGHAFLATDPSDVRWLSGFTGSNGWVVVSMSASMLVTDGRYVEQARHEIGGSAVEIVEARSRTAMVEAVSRMAPGPLGARFEAIDLALHGEIVRAGSSVVDRGDVMRTVRRVKDADELARIERACAIADRAFAESIDVIDVDRTERDLRDELEYRMRRHGADGPSYATIVAAGPSNSARPHHQPTTRPFQFGDSVVIDVGALVDGYHSDMTRTVIVGEPSGELRTWYELVERSQVSGRLAVRAGASAREVDRVCRDVFEEAGVGRYFVHGTGHGVGLDIHETPFLNPQAPEDLLVGEVVTVEPGLYREGLGGVRIEDLVLVLPDGHRPLTGTPKELTCLPSRPTI